MTVLIENRQKSIVIKDDILSLIRKVAGTSVELEQLPYDCEVSVILADDEGIRELNREYRGRDVPTDVLSFSMVEGEEVVDVNEDGEAIIGDIIISMERAREQAEEYGHSMEREVAYLTVHGVLHLLGYDHMEENDKEIMRKREEEILELLGLKRRSAEGI